MMRQLLLGVAAAASLGAATLLSPDTAQAQSWSITIGERGGYHHRPRRDGWHGHGFRGGFPDRGFGGWSNGRGHWGGARPVYGHGFGYHQPHCVVRKVRYWDGWGWVVDRRRVCN